MTKPIPTHSQKEADTLVNKLLSDRLIEPVQSGKISDWISLAFFIPKDAGRQVFALSQIPLS